MSKARRRYIATIAVFGSLSVALLFALAFRRGGRFSYELPRLEGVNGSDVEAITIERLADTITLTRSGDRWLVSPGGYPADAAGVRSILEAITGIQITDVVSQRGDPAVYGLDEGSRVRVTLQGGGDPLRVIDVGGRGATLSDTYVAIPGDGRILRAHGEIRAFVDREVDDLRDKRVLSFDPALVKRVELVSGPLSVVATRSGESWSTDRGEALKAEEVNQALAFLSELSAYRYRSSDDPLPPRWLTVTISADQALVLEIYGEEDSTYPATSSQSPYPFLMFLFQASLITEPFGMEPPSDD